jgi:outer membrane protein assembly factor BamD (BamD/ComL family)
MTMQYGSQLEPLNWSRRLLSRRVPAVLLFLSVVSGCVTPWEKYALMKDTSPNIDKVQGPEERRLRNLFWMQKQTTAADESDSLKPLVGTEDYLAATDLYKDDQFEEAQAAFKNVAKKYKKSEIREDALFMQAESAFQRKHYAKAHDIYGTLLKEYPSTRHLDVVSERLFKIGKIWLDFPEIAKIGEIQQVNFEDPRHKLPAEVPTKINKTPIFVPNFRDKTRPLFDTPGNGVAALQAIWMNDPTGPLADDAMMLAASYHARRGNYIEADRYFRMLRETFPNSPHLQEAFLLGSHVKLMSYQGADYDDKSLFDAQALKESTLRMYPNIPDADRLKEELARIEEAKAEREWKSVEFWTKKRNPRATAVMCHQLISHFPDSRYADKAREKLVALGPEYASGANLLQPVDPPSVPLWQRILPQAQPKPEAKSSFDYAEDESNEKSPSRWIPNPFGKKQTPRTDELSEDSSESPDPGTSSLKDNESGEGTPRKRGWFRWSPPQLLPKGTDDDAKKIDASDDSGDPDDPGRSKL